MEKEFLSSSDNEDNEDNEENKDDIIKRSIRTQGNMYKVNKTKNQLLNDLSKLRLNYEFSKKNVEKLKNKMKEKDEKLYESQYNNIIMNKNNDAINKELSEKNLYIINLIYLIVFIAFTCIIL